MNQFFLNDTLAIEQKERIELKRAEAVKLALKRQTEAPSAAALDRLAQEQAPRSRRTLQTNVGGEPDPQTYEEEPVDPTELNQIYGLVSVEGERFRFEAKTLKPSSQS